MQKNGDFFGSFVEGRAVRKRVQEVLHAAQVDGRLEDVKMLKEAGVTLYYAIVRDKYGFQTCYKVDLTKNELV